MALNQIPYTNVHELNLDWVMQKIREFDAKITAFQAVIDEFAQYVDVLVHLEPRVAALENEYSALNTTVGNLQNYVNTLHNSITSLENALEREKNTRGAADADLQRQIDEINNSMVNVANLERRIKIYVDQKIIGSEKRTDEKLQRAYLQMNSYYIELMDYINDIYDLLSHVATDVYNSNAYAYATDGRIPFDLNNKLVYLHCDNALSAEEYCSLGLSADDYATFNLTAERYLMYSHKELHYDYVFMPLSGVKQDHSVALSEVVNSIFDTLSADDYALLDLDADDYALLDLDANDYRRLNLDGDLTHRIRYSDHGSGLTADQYAHLNMID